MVQANLSDVNQVSRQSDGSAGNAAPPEESACLSPTNARPSDVRGWLDHVRTALGGDGTPHAALAGLDGMAGSLDQLVDEHAGMAEELLAVYEQLGVVFEVTRRLPGLHDELQMLELFLESVSRSFSQCAAALVRPNEIDASDWVLIGGGITINAWLSQRIEQARCERRTMVASTPPSSSVFGDVSVEVLVAPIFSGDDFVAAVVLARTSQMAPFSASDMLVIESLATFCGDLVRNHRLVKEVRDMSFATVRALVNAVDQKDPYTCGHSVRVAYYATLLGKTLDMTDAELEMLQWAALLHDVGKIGIRDDVLKKTGKLTKDEFEHIKEHPVRSYQVVKEVPQLAAALDGVRHHHEYYTGGGYPDGIAGRDIPLAARVIQIADVFDALTSARSYRAPYDWKNALSIMRAESGSRLDPALLPVFVNLLEALLADGDEAWARVTERAERFAEEWHPALGSD